MLREPIRFCYIAKLKRTEQSRPAHMVVLDIPSLRQLRAFDAVARLESVSEAAREVSLSQPALTQSLHSLETRLRTRLFERRRSGSYLTELGVILVLRVRRFFDHIRSALAEPVVGAPFTGRQSADTIINKLTRPTSIHQQFLDLLRAQARALTAFSSVRPGRSGPDLRTFTRHPKSARRRKSAGRPRRLRVQ
jgi:hypothetical protein